MLNIFNELQVFFNDCYRRVSVREYAKIARVSPPTASKILQNYEKEGILTKEIDRGYHFYSAHRDNIVFLHLSRLYWAQRLGSIAKHLEHELIDPTIILFGSLAKAEATQSSDVDIALFASKDIDIHRFEKELGRPIQLFRYKSLKEIKNRELAANIINGYVLRGLIRV